MKYKTIIPNNMSLAAAKEENLLFVDKTRYIDWLENDSRTNAAVFLRPRRFGKTFFIILLKSYYDRALKQHFDRNFAGTWIGSHKTSKASSYFCLDLDFSDVSSQPGDVCESFMFSLASSLKRFSWSYPLLEIPVEKLEPGLYKKPSELMTFFLENFNQAMMKAPEDARGSLYVLIDEYDHFANEVLSRDKDEFKRITSTSNENEGFIKQFYACLKKYYGGVPGKPIGRFFITGVSSVSLNSITSGFNIATNISDMPGCSAMVGLTHDELSGVIDETVDFSRLKGVSKSELMETMERLYDGYVFSCGNSESVFNTTMCLGYLNEVITSGSLVSGMPHSIIESDAGMLEGMMRLADDGVVDSIADRIFSRQSLAANPPVSLNLNQSDHFDFSEMVSLLKYLGFISFAPGNEQNSPALNYQCPNEVYYQIFLKYFEDRRGFKNGIFAKLKDMASEKADISPLLENVEKIISDLPDTGFSGFNEKTLQMCFDFALRSDPDGKLRPYLELDTGAHGRVDVLVMNSSIHGRNFLFELKYLPKGKSSAEAVSAKLAEAKAQLLQYRIAPRIKSVPRLDCWAVVFAGGAATAAEKV